MLVKDIMTQSVKVARPDDLVRDVVSVMCLNKISGMPAVDAGENLIGVISEKDVLHAMFPTFDDMIENPQPVDFEALEHEYKDIVSLKVSDLMSKRVFTVEPDMPLLRAASIMFRNRIRRIPVSVDNKLVGISLTLFGGLFYTACPCRRRQTFVRDGNPVSHVVWYTLYGFRRPLSMSD